MRPHCSSNATTARTSSIAETSSTKRSNAAFVRGLQGDHPKYMKAAACAKHYAVHSGPEKDRHTFNAVVSKLDLYGTYLPAFKKLVTEAKL